MKYQLAFDSFIGRRQENQDAVLSCRVSEETFLIGIADGMGGTNGGRIASHLVVDSIIEFVKGLDPSEISEDSLKPILSRCYRSANNKLQDRIAADPELAGMGTTLCMIIIHKGKYAWANIGDSRIYEVDEDGMKLLTVDHTYLQQYKNETSEELPEELRLKYEHYLTKCIDGKYESPDLFPTDSSCLEFSEEKQFLLCSDGLIINKYDDDHSILRDLFQSGKTIEKGVEKMIKYAFDNGSNDNISVASLRVTHEGKESGWEGKPVNSKIKITPKKSGFLSGNKLIIGLITLFIGVCFAVLIIGMSETDSSSTESNTNLTTKWIPLRQSDYEYPLSNKYHIHWQPYPNYKDVKRYQLKITKGETEIYLEKFPEDTYHVPVTEFQLEIGVKYGLELTVLLDDDREVVGNSIQFSISD
ncbi:MAG: serine/threonine-protein phosphatase [Cyclobacteriaceae bacterium]